jgi:pyruvate/2-oxoglutarate/acetoin dehydrogenase E1 component/TPP-dependent pyruvate/acetoin dehydrogenase alpha subunit
MVQPHMQLTMREAIKLAIADEMRADPAVVVFGEDVADAGGVFKVTTGLLDEFGGDRVRDTPIAETAIIGAAIGAAAKGLRPVVEIMFAEFFGVALDQVVTEAAKMRYLSGGKLTMPIVLRASAAGGLGFGSQHSQTLESWFMNTPGLVVVSPSGPAAAYSLLRCAIRDQDPVIFLEPRNLYNTKEEVETGDAALWPLGTARIVRSGTDVTVAALGQMVGVALKAAELVPDISCEVIDLGTARPWDRATVLGSVERTGRIVIVEENPHTGGWGADIASAVAAEGFEYLDAPPTRVACPDVPVPFGALERHYLPSSERVADAIKGLVRSGTAAARVTASANAAPVATRAESGDASRRAALADPLGRYARMVEIRLIEDESMNLYLEGLIAGSMHTGQGQEAVAVGIAASLRPTDFVTCTYRGHGLALALGLTPLALIAEMLGRKDGSLGGKGGSMHLSAPEIGLLPTFAIVGGGIPVAVGAAFASQVKRDGGVAVAAFGDGAANIGAFHEALNMASVWRLPAVFVCENNLYGEYSRIEKTTPITDIADRAAAYAMPGEIVDGQDVDMVMAAMSKAVARARSGEGPTLLEMKTYRYAGHSRGDPAKYRPAGELEKWKERDPIALYERALIAAGTVDAAKLADLRAEVERGVASAIAAAKASPMPDAASIFEHVSSRGV